jgi:hypothetical protein
VVIQSFSQAERLGGGEQEGLSIDAKGNIDLASAHRPGLDPLYTTNVLRFPPGGAKVAADTAMPGLAASPQVAGDSSGSIYLTWMASSSSSTIFFNHAEFSRSDDGGGTFTFPVTVFSSGGFAHMALDSAGNIFVSWLGSSISSTNNSAFVSRSIDGGKTFTASPPISDVTKRATGPHLAVTSSGKVDVIWQYNDNLGQECDSVNGFHSCTSCDIWFAQSTDAGKSFPAPVNISNSSGCAGLDSNYDNDEQMQADSAGNVNIVWDDSISGVMFRRSTDGGSTFSMPTNVSTAQGVFPRIAVDSGGNINVVWEPSSGGGFFFSRSTDGGATFSQPMPLGTGSGADAVVATDANGDIDVAWIEAPLLRFSQSVDGGKTFSSPLTLNKLDVTQVTPDILPSLRVHMAVEADGTVDVAYGTDQLGGTGERFVWFSHGSTSSTALPAPLFLNVGLSDGTVGKAYSGAAAPTGGAPPYSISVTGLPPGLSLQGSTSTGSPVLISGTPTTAGTFVATFTLNDSAGVSLTSPFSFTIAPSSSSSVSAISGSR